MKKFISALALASMLALSPAHAYYGKTDQPEFFQILPNESAFFIPNTGANKDSQTHMDSEEYYNANKIATKLFQVPHGSVPSGTGLASLFGGYVVPSGRLILVDRRPYHREWTTKGRGTNGAVDESFHCQSNDGLNVTVEISISTYVTEENAAKFLYYFGVKSDPNADRNDPNVIFQSVYHGFSLTEVMDGVVRGSVHNAVCDEMSKHSLADADQHMYDIMTDIRKLTGEYLAKKGINLDYIGWAGTWEFDPNVQASLNRNFESTQDQAVAKALAPYADTMLSLALVEATRAISSKWDGKLPTTLSGLWLFPSSLLDGVKKIASAIAPAAATVTKP